METKLDYILNNTRQSIKTKIKKQLSQNKETLQQKNIRDRKGIGNSHVLQFMFRHKVICGGNNKTQYMYTVCLLIKKLVKTHA